jgi:hypothetical protein
MPPVGFAPTIPFFDRVKTVHALDRAATVIGVRCTWAVSFQTIFVNSVSNILV